jgi:anti-sigma regulatory factor (Ser/Thr protein kinase)
VPAKSHHLGAGRQARIDLAPDPVAASQARAFVTTTISRWGLAGAEGPQPMLDTAELLTSELVTNGVLHAGTPLGICVRLADATLTVEVTDHDPRPPIPRGQRVSLLDDIDELLGRAADEPEETHEADERHITMYVGPAGAIGAGRGLLLVEALADEWGVQQQAEGKSVWFRLAVA